MFGWLFGKKKTQNDNNVCRRGGLQVRLAGMSKQDKVKSLRRLKTMYTYNSDADICYGDDMANDMIMFYLLMEMTDVVSEEEAGFFDIENDIGDDDIVIGDIGDDNILIDEIGDGSDNIDDINDDSGLLDLSEMDEEADKIVEPISIPVEEIHIIAAPQIEEPVAVEKTETFVEKAETFGDDFKAEDTSDSFGDSFGSDDSGGDDGGD